MTVNTITIHEDQSVGRIASIKVEIWNGSDWQMAAETECSRLPSKKNIFFNTSTVSRLRLTLVNEGESPMAVKEITVKESSEEEMPVDTELITLQPDIKPNEYQQQMVNNGYTMFVHFGLNTFTETEWTYGDVSPSVYAPPEIDADQWVKTVKEAGMKTILLVTKHHDGFCLWDSEYTDYDVANEESGNHQDVVKAVSDACNKYGINLGIYYSAWDNNWDLNHGKQNDAEYNEYMRNQITELLGGDYGLNGQITELWIDGNWEKEADRWEFDRLYDTVKKLQPQCQIGINLTIGSGINGGAIRVQDQQEGDNIGYFPSDFRIYDGQETASGADADPKLFSYRGQTYYLPFEATLILNKSWFWHTGYGSVPSREPASIADNYNKYKSQGNILVLNCGPNREGKIEQADIDYLYAAARMLGIASGDALKRPYTEILEEYRGKNLALNATGYSNETYTGDGAENHGPDEMFDGDNSTRWATRGGDKLSSVDITLDGEKEFNYLCIQEGTGFFRTDSILLEYQDAEGEWKKLAENVPFNENGRLELRFNENVKAKNLRLSLSDAEEEGPTIAEFQLYMIDSMPELEYIAEKTDLIPGESVSLHIVDSEEQVSFKAVCEFISENEAVASVDPDGNITAIAEGDTKIIARAVIFGETMEVTIPIHVQHVQHIFDQEVVAPEYLVREATCTGAALYYKSCVCGEMGTETFEDPQGALGHSFGAEWKHDSSGHWKECICGEKKGLEAHISDGGKVTKAATANNEGIKTYTCTVCGKELKTEKIPRISSVIQPSEPSNPSNTETNAALTGDSSDLVLWGILALIAGCATVAGVYLNQKKKRSK